MVTTHLRQRPVDNLDGDWSITVNGQRYRDEDRRFPAVLALPGTPRPLATEQLARAGRADVTPRSQRATLMAVRWARDPFAGAPDPVDDPTAACGPALRRPSSSAPLS